MDIKKRNGKIEKFDKNKIRNVVIKANKSIEPLEPMLPGIPDRIADLVEAKCKEMTVVPTVEAVQNIVEEEIMRAGYYKTAIDYVRYRHDRELARKSNTTDVEVLSLLARTNVEIKDENSNKNPVLNSTQRDYMAGIMSTDIANRLLLTPELVKADQEGIIHIHDKDYMANSEHNCFSGDTKFLTKEGYKAFNEFKPGTVVEVMSHTGCWRKAVVSTAGEQEMQLVKMYQPMTGDEITFKATLDHTWILCNGKRTTCVMKGDTLLVAPDELKEEGYVEEVYPWIVLNIEKSVKDVVWCATVEEDHSFILEKGIVTGNCDLVNLEDMLQNGTVISNTMIEKPHSFSTACNIATQVVAQVASSQFGLKK